MTGLTFPSRALVVPLDTLLLSCMCMQMRLLRDSESSGREFTFILLPPEGHRVYVLATATMGDLAGWIGELAAAGCRNMPPDGGRPEDDT